MKPELTPEMSYVKLDGVAMKLHELAGCLYTTGNTQLADTLNDLCESVNDSNTCLKPDDWSDEEDDEL